MNFSASMDAVNRQVESHRTSAKAIADQGVPSNPVMAATSGPSGGMLGYGQRLVKHDEQYKHNVGWAYVATRAIAWRIAGQDVCVGRIGRRGRKSIKALGDNVTPLDTHPL